MASLDSGIRSSYSEQQSYLETWTLPASDSDYSSLVLAVEENKETKLNKPQLQFIHDFLKQKLSSRFQVKYFLEECDAIGESPPPYLRKLEEHRENVGQSDAHDTNQREHSDIPEENRDSGSYSDGDIEADGAHAGTDTVDGAAAKTIKTLFSCVANQSDPTSKRQTSKNTQVSKEKKKKKPKAKKHDETTNQAPETPHQHSKQQVATGSSKQGVTTSSSADQEKLYLHNKLTALQKEHEILDRGRKCIECRSRPRDITFLPCGHFVMCKSCSEPIYECPNCNRDILATAQTYLS